MTEVSAQMYEVICKWCGNCQEMQCLADVPWYCCSVGCNYFNEGEVVEPKKKKRAHTMKYIMKRTLVETI